MSESQSVYGRMVAARDRNEQTNGRIIKPFKAQHGKKDLFYNNELVSVALPPIQMEEPVYIVTGVSFNEKYQSFDIKTAAMSEEQLNKYVKLTGEVVTLEPSSPKTFCTKFVSKNSFNSLNGIKIPKGAFITKTVVVLGGGTSDEKIEVEDYPEAIVDNEKLSMFCTVTEPRHEVT